MKKDKFEWKLLKQLFDYLNLSESKVVLIILCFFVTTGTGFLQPLVIKNITDNGLINQKMQVIIYSVSLLLVLILMSKLTDVFLSKLFADIHNESEYTIYRKAFKKLLKLKYEYFIDKNSSEIINMLSTDVSTVTSITDRNNVMLISYLFQIISGLAGLIIISPILTVIVLIMVPVKYVTVTKLAKLREKKIVKYLKEITRFSSWMSDTINGVKEIKLWNEYKGQEAEFCKREQTLLKRKKSFTMIDAWNSFIEIFLEWIVMGLLYILGGTLLIKGQLSLGGLLAFISYSSFVTGPIAAIFNIKMLFAQIIPSARRFVNFMNLSEETCGNLLDSNPGDLRFDNVSFSYNSQKVILENVSFSLPLNSKIAIIGDNGSGKSTMLNLLLRFLEPDSGTIKLHGINIQDLNIENYRKMFSVVSQNPYLFNKSIKDNIDLEGNKTEEDLEAIYKKSGVDRYLKRMPQKENSIIGNNGARLSGGEQQKLAVARALIRDTPYVILDEATSEYDVDSDAYLHSSLISNMENKTIIIVTHKYKNLEGMDIIYKIKEGKIIKVK